MKIKTLTLLTRNLQGQKAFYTNVLGFDLLEENNQFFALQIGETILKFVADATATMYHFALNIPSNQEVEACEWLKNVTEILPFEGDEILNFEDWNAKAMYFHDADNNILEFIARKNLKAYSTAPFCPSSSLEISEIGTPVSNVEETLNTINQYLKSPLSLYSGDLNRFCALGDEHGLFIIINKKIKKWIPTMVDAPSSSYELEMEVDGELYNLAFKNAKFELMEIIKL